MWKEVLFAIAVLGSCEAYQGTQYCLEGRDVIVNLFEWKWTDIQAECVWLAVNGYCAVQVSPPQEHAVIRDFDPPYPWWERYQPVSYKMQSRSGSEQEFTDMVAACNDVGVFIYADAVINHMTGPGNGTGSAGSIWEGDLEDYPGVPYTADDFHKQAPDECTSESGNVDDYQDAQEVRFCRLYGLRDLKTEGQNVRSHLTGYMNKLIDWGVAGFSVDAIKYVRPEDLNSVYSGLINLPSKWFPGGTKPFIYQDIADKGDDAISATEYTGLGKVSEIKYSINIGEIFRKMEGRALASLKDFGEDFLKSENVIVFVDNHDIQRGHGTAGEEILNYKDGKLYKMATAFKLAWPYGLPKVMSSYEFTDTEAGPPSSEDGNANDVTCFTDWVCEHRWREISNMVKFHNVVAGTSMENWWDNGANAIAFSRGSKGFLVINNEDYTVTETFSTGLPAGEYCDVITSESHVPPCSGRSVTVEAGGSLTVSVDSDGGDPMIAIHV